MGGIHPIKMEVFADDISTEYVDGVYTFIKFNEYDDNEVLAHYPIATTLVTSILDNEAYEEEVEEEYQDDDIINNAIDIIGDYNNFRNLFSNR